MDDNELRSYFRVPTEEDMERVRESMRPYEEAAKRAAEARVKRIAVVIDAHTPYIARNGETACRDNNCPYRGNGLDAHYRHVAELVIANVEQDAYPNYCPYDCDSCHDEDCPCDRLGCAGCED